MITKIVTKTNRFAIWFSSSQKSFWPSETRVETWAELRPHFDLQSNIMQQNQLFIVVHQTEIQ